jgi:hypothetical protein
VSPATFAKSIVAVIAERSSGEMFDPDVRQISMGHLVDDDTARRRHRHRVDDWNNGDIDINRSAVSKTDGTHALRTPLRLP